jgi:4-carboxymuconolactone decarboxylase
MGSTQAVGTAQGTDAPEAARVAEREAYITGRPPRITPLAPEEMSPDATKMVAELRRVVGLPPDAPVPEFTATCLKHPRLFREHTNLALVVMKGEIPDRDRELVVLRVGWLLQAPFEWTEHVKIGKRLADFTTEEIERVTIGSSAPGWSERDRAVLKATEELLADAMISDETWDALSRYFDEKQLLELPILVGQYVGVGFLQNSIRARLMPGGIGLTAR